jgi:hypothetical protein
LPPLFLDELPTHRIEKTHSVLPFKWFLRLVLSYLIAAIAVEAKIQPEANIGRSGETF